MQFFLAVNAQHQIVRQLPRRTTGPYVMLTNEAKAAPVRAWKDAAFRRRPRRAVEKTLKTEGGAFGQHILHMHKKLLCSWHDVFAAHLRAPTAQFHIKQIRLRMTGTQRFQVTSAAGPRISNKFFLI